MLMLMKVSVKQDIKIKIEQKLIFLAFNKNV
jgi:hypothetical protein